MSDGGATDAFLRLLADRAASDPSYLAWVVRSYAEAENRSTADVLAQVGVADKSVSDFLVSLRPTGERFAYMVKTICVRFGVSETALLTVLREVEVLDAFRASSPASAGATDAGLLMAARMRERESRPRRVAETTEGHRDDEDADDEDDAR